MADLQDFVEDVVTNKINYCAVCFRTEKERKLVSPTALSKFAKYTALEQLSDTEYACVFCERQAQLAVELHNRLCFARHVSRVLRSLINKKSNSPKSIAYVLPSKLRGQLSGPNSVKRNKLLSSMRQYQTYLQTEVLLIDSTVKNTATSDASNEIFIIDDEDSLTNVPPRLVPIEKLLERKTNPNQQTDKIVLYPLQTADNSNDQFLVISNVPNNFTPNDNIPVLLPNGSIVLTRNTNQNVNLTVNNNLNKTNAVNNANKNLDTINVNNINKITVPVISTVTHVFNEDSNMTMHNVNASNGTNTVLNNKNYSVAQSNRRAKDTFRRILPKGGINNFNFVNNPIGQEQDSLSKISDVEANDRVFVPFDKAVNDVADVPPKGGNLGINDEMCQITNLRTLADDDFNDKQPETKKNHTIDWEDKIPMDVISFMNASDPNAPELLKKSQPKTPAHSISTAPLITPTRPVIPSTLPVIKPTQPVMTSTQPNTHLLFNTLTTQNIINQVLDNMSKTSPDNAVSPNQEVTTSTIRGRGRPRKKRKSVDDDVIIIS